MDYEEAVPISPARRKKNSVGEKMKYPSVVPDIATDALRVEDVRLTQN